MEGWISDIYEEGLVSIVIPTYNRMTFLEEALKSVAEQTYRPIECIIVDDGSTDNTRDMLHQLLENANPGLTFKYIFQQNAGAQVARNTGTLASKGEFIQYLDSDDILFNDKIERQVTFFRKNYSCDCVFGDWGSGYPEKYNLIKAHKSDDFISQLLTGVCIANFAILMRREIIKQAGMWDTSVKRNQEVDYHLSALMKGANFEYQSSNCGVWRYHVEDRIHNKTGLNEIVHFYKKWEAILLDHKLFTRKLGTEISAHYLYLFSQNQEADKETKLNVLKEIVRLNPEVAFYKNPKLQLLVKIIGLEKALLVWARKFRKSSSVQSNT